MNTIRVTKLEKTKIDNGTKTALEVFGRTQDNEVKSVTVTGHPPRFWVRTDELDDKKMRNGLRHDGEVLKVEDGHTSIYGEDLTEIQVKKSSYVGELREQFDRHYSADVLYPHRARYDLGIETGLRYPDSPDDRVDVDDIEPVDMTDVDYRVVTFDIENDDRQGIPIRDNRVRHTDSAILSIAAHDSVDDNLVVFMDSGGRHPSRAFSEWWDSDAETIPDEKMPDEVDHLKVYENERRMLIAFRSWLQAKDPDILTAWNVDYDMKVLMSRMDNEELHMDSSVFARNNGWTSTAAQYTPKVYGRHVYDLQQAYQTTKFTGMQSYRLEYIAQEELDTGKIPHQDMGYYEMWQKDPEKFVRYNAMDTELAVRINREANVLPFKQSLQERDGAPFDMTMNNGDLLEVTLRRELQRKGLVGPSSYQWKKDYPDEEETDFEGGMVLDAYDGLAKNVVGIDVDSLYPNNIAQLNISPETKIEEMKAITEDIPYVKAPNGACFRLDVTGILSGLVDRMLETKADMKQRLKEMPADHPDKDDVEENYNVLKTIVNSLFGVSGWERFFLYDPETAGAITSVGQFCIDFTREWVNENTNGTVIYGDTDSNYVAFPDSWSAEKCEQRAIQIAQKLNEDVYPQLVEESFTDLSAADCRWSIEPEAYARTYFQHGSKKFYAYLEVSEYSEEDGEVFFESHAKPKVKINGYQCVKSSSCELTQDTQRAVLEAILRERPKSDIVDIIQEAASQIKRGMDIEGWEYIGIPQGLGQKIDKEKAGQEDYYGFTNGTPKMPHPRGVWYANRMYDLEIMAGAKPKRVYLDPSNSVGQIDVICFETAADLAEHREDFRLDVDRMVNTVVKSPVENILETLDMSPDAAVAGRTETQQTLGGFC